MLHEILCKLPTFKQIEVRGHKRYFFFHRLSFSHPDTQFLEIRDCLFKAGGNFHPKNNQSETVRGSLWSDINNIKIQSYWKLFVTATTRNDNKTIFKIANSTKVHVTFG